jgi:replicative DNA helicase
MIGLPTGFKNLDTLTGGLQGTDVVILAAPPLVDEASLSLSIALNAGTLFQRGIGLFSLEMNRYQVVQRLLAMSADIDLYRLRTGQLNEEESKQLSIAGKTLAKAHLWIDDRIGPTMDQLQQRVRQLVEIHDVDLIIVDNIHLISKSMANKAYEFHSNESSEVGQRFKTLARELYISIVVRSPMYHTQKSLQRKNLHCSDSHQCSPCNGSEHLLCLYRDVPSSLVTTGDTVMTIMISIAKQRKGLVTEVEAALLPSQPHVHHQ